MEVAPVTPPSTTKTAAEQPEGKQRPKFASMHTLLMRVDHPNELPEGSIWLREADGLLHQRAVKGVEGERLQVLHDAIAAGRVYALWDHRYLEFNELSPQWVKGGRE